MAQFDVFISHTGKDVRQKELARQIAFVFLLNGKSVWFDENQIRHGDKLDETLKKGIRQSSRFLLLWSKESSCSTSVKLEYEYADSWVAEGGNQKIITIRLDETHIPEILTKYIWLDLDESLFGTHMQSLLGLELPNTFSNQLMHSAALCGWHSYSPEIHRILQLEIESAISQLSFFKERLISFKDSFSDEELADTLNKLLNSETIKQFPVLNTPRMIPLGDGRYELFFPRRMRIPPKVSIENSPKGLELVILNINEVLMSFAFRNSLGEFHRGLVPFTYTIAFEAEL